MELRVARDLVEGMYDAAALLDKELRLLAGNASYGRMVGLRPRALAAQIGRRASTFDLLIASDGLDRSSAETCVAQRKSQHVAEQKLRNLTGQEFTTWVSFLPVTDESGAVIGVVQIIRDVTGETATHLRLRELLALTQARADSLERAVEQRTKELRAALDEVTRLSRTDPLTGLLNRRAFGEAADQALALARRHGRTAAVLMCDLDRFKQINDTFGHQAGDAMLQAVTRALRGCFRESDLLCRFGGEEFVVLLTETSADLVEEVANRCRQVVSNIRAAEVVPEMTSAQTVSIGVSIYPSHAQTLEQLIDVADKALYVAKEQGRNQVVVFGPSAEARTQDIVYVSKPRVLAVIDDRWAAATEASLASSFDVVMTSSPERARELARRNPFEVIVASQSVDGKLGVDLLGGTLEPAPSAVRFLLTEDLQSFHAIRGNNLAKVDGFLLVEEVASSVRDAIRDALARRDIERGLLGKSLSRGSYTRPIDQIQRLLQERSLRFLFQPIVNRQGELFAYEVFCRPPDEMRLTPNELFEEAARTGDIWRVGRMTRDGIATELERIPRETLVFVKLHPAELRDPELICGQDELARFRDQIVFEIQNYAPAPRVARSKSDIDALRRLGFRIAIDEPGSGYGGLSAIDLLEPDFLKLSEQFIRGLHESKTRFDFVARIAERARSHRASLLASGIESKAEADACAAAGFQLLQGFHFGPPLEL